ncbi:NUDIX hydrolase [Radiobacillus sp. PE A8.2]|uniref:NUDIX hydrolase n=1 Tax=Radiobacillus sp. PE A8.2 TaxID=3380349 RepID=UPI00389025A7
MDYISYLRSMVGHEKVIMVVAGALVFDASDRLLLHLRSDNQTWGLPGGYMELGESVSDTARREAFEETGLRLGALELFSIYSGPENEKTLQNGDQVSLVQIWFTCKDFGGELVEQNEESLDVKFFELNNLPDNFFPSQKKVINDFLSDGKTPYVKE